MFLHASVIFNVERISVQFIDGLCNTLDMTLDFFFSVPIRCKHY